MDTRFRISAFLVIFLISFNATNFCYSQPLLIRFSHVVGENTPKGIGAKMFKELRPYFVETNHSYLGYMVVTSNKFWESVPDDIRSELEVILDEVTLEVNTLAEHKADFDRASVLSDSKVHITTLTATERQLWKDAMVPIWKNYENEIGVDILDATKASKQNKT